MSSLLLIGGARSGKSAWAIRYADSFHRKTFLATARADDGEMKERIQRHQRERGAGWNTVEVTEGLYSPLQEAMTASDIVIVDCLTVWVGQMIEKVTNEDQFLQSFVHPLFELVSNRSCTLIFITNEVGSGIVPSNPLARSYRDRLGRVNHFFAQSCTTVLGFTAGIPVVLKGILPRVDTSPSSPPHTQEPIPTHGLSFQEKAWRHLDCLTKPPRSLGRVEEIAVRLCSIQQTLQPNTRPCSVLIFAGDHGVCEEGVSAFPSSVTMEMLRNMANGGACVSVLSRLYGASLTLVDVGCMGEPVKSKMIVNQRVRPGTGNMARQQALTPDEVEQAMQVGSQAVISEVEKGARLLIIGEMGIGNTTSAAALTAGLLSLPAETVVGWGTGINETQRRNKIAAVKKALHFHAECMRDGKSLLGCYGGLEIAAMTGAYLQAESLGVPTLMDGLIGTVAAAAALKFSPTVNSVLFATHVSQEPAHIHLLNYLGLKPLLDLQMRLGEASGALMALPIFDSAAALFNEMATFDSAQVSGPCETSS